MIVIAFGVTYASLLLNERRQQPKEKKKWYKLSKSLAIWFPCLQSIIIESLDIQKWEIKRLIKKDSSFGNFTNIHTRCPNFGKLSSPIFLTKSASEAS